MGFAFVGSAAGAVAAADATAADSEAFWSGAHALRGCLPRRCDSRGTTGMDIYDHVKSLWWPPGKPVPEGVLLAGEGQAPWCADRCFSEPTRFRNGGFSRDWGSAGSGVTSQSAPRLLQTYETQKEAEISLYGQ
eukprot:6184180-Pleurochrysis_carterae.AAC.2